MFKKIGLVIILLSPAVMFAQTPFKGGSDNGLWNAGLANSACVTQGAVSPFYGSPGAGDQFANMLNSSCVVSAALSPFNGGKEQGEVFASAILSECATLATPSPFNGGINDGYSMRRRTNYNCDGPNSTIDSISPKKICEGEEITIWGTYFSDVFEVYFNHTPAIYFTVEDSVTITATIPQGATSGLVEVHGPDGTAYSSSNLSISPLPVAGFSYAQESGFTFGFTSTGSNASNYFWDFGEGNTSTIPNPSFTFADNGTYPVTLIVTNDCGIDTLTEELNINTVGGLASARIEMSVVPNPFKDLFELRFNAVGPIRITLFNMLGQMVYDRQVYTSGTTFYPVEMQGYKPGIYTVRISGNGIYGNHRVVKGE